MWLNEITKNKKSLLLVILSVGAVASLTYGILTPSKIRREIKAKTKGAPAVRGAPTPSLQKRVLAVERGTAKSTFAFWGRSPFLPKESAIESSTVLVLNGIAWDEKTPQAIINDRIVGVGDEISGKRVVAIHPVSVVLNDGFEDFELKLGHEK